MKESGQKKSYIKRKEVDQKIRKISNRIKSIESSIENTESKISEMDLIMSASNEVQDIDFYKKYEQFKQKLNLTIPEWEKLHNMLEKLRDERNSVF